jgi:hypothetical protein
VSASLPDHVCGAMGCHTDSHDEDLVVIQHPTHGERVVCREHAADYEVVRHV